MWTNMLRDALLEFKEFRTRLETQPQATSTDVPVISSTPNTLLSMTPIQPAQFNPLSSQGTSWLVPPNEDLHPSCRMSESTTTPQLHLRGGGPTARSKTTQTPAKPTAPIPKTPSTTRKPKTTQTLANTKKVNPKTPAAKKGAQTPGPKKTAPKTPSKKDPKTPVAGKKGAPKTPAKTPAKSSAKTPTAKNNPPTPSPPKSDEEKDVTDDEKKDNDSDNKEIDKDGKDGNNKADRTATQDSTPKKTPSKNPSQSSPNKVTNTVGTDGKKLPKQKSKAPEMDSDYIPPRHPENVRDSWFESFLNTKTSNEDNNDGRPVLGDWKIPFWYKESTRTIKFTGNHLNHMAPGKVRGVKYPHPPEGFRNDGVRTHCHLCGQDFAECKSVAEKRAHRKICPNYEYSEVGYSTCPSTSGSDSEDLQHPENRRQKTISRNLFVDSSSRSPDHTSSESEDSDDELHRQHIHPIPFDETEKNVQFRDANYQPDENWELEPARAVFRRREQIPGIMGRRNGAAWFYPGSMLAQTMHRPVKMVEGQGGDGITGQCCGRCGTKWYGGVQGGTAALERHRRDCNVVSHPGVSDAEGAKRHNTYCSNMSNYRPKVERPRWFKVDDKVEPAKTSRPKHPWEKAIQVPKADASFSTRVIPADKVAKIRDMLARHKDMRRHYELVPDPNNPSQMLLRPKVPPLSSETEVSSLEVSDSVLSSSEDETDEAYFYVLETDEEDPTGPKREVRRKRMELNPDYEYFSDKNDPKAPKMRSKKKNADGKNEDDDEDDDDEWEYVTDEDDSEAPKKRRRKTKKDSKKDNKQDESFEVLETDEEDPTGPKKKVRRKKSELDPDYEYVTDEDDPDAPKQRVKKKTPKKSPTKKNTPKKDGSKKLAPKKQKKKNGSDSEYEFQETENSESDEVNSEMKLKPKGKKKASKKDEKDKTKLPASMLWDPEEVIEVEEEIIDENGDKITVKRKRRMGSIYYPSSGGEESDLEYMPDPKAVLADISGLALAARAARDFAMSKFTNKFGRWGRQELVEACDDDEMMDEDEDVEMSGMLPPGVVSWNRSSSITTFQDSDDEMASDPPTDIYYHPSTPTPKPKFTFHHASDEAILRSQFYTNLRNRQITAIPFNTPQTQPSLNIAQVRNVPDERIDIIYAPRERHRRLYAPLPEQPIPLAKPAPDDDDWFCANDERFKAVYEQLQRYKKGVEKWEVKEDEKRRKPFYYTVQRRWRKVLAREVRNMKKEKEQREEEEARIWPADTFPSYRLGAGGAGYLVPPVDNIGTTGVIAAGTATAAVTGITATVTTTTVETEVTGAVAMMNMAVQASSVSVTMVGRGKDNVAGSKKRKIDENGKEGGGKRVRFKDTIRGQWSFLG